MAQPQKIFIPTFISSIDYKPARVLPHVYFWNGTKATNTYYVQSYVSGSTNALTASALEEFPYFDNIFLQNDTGSQTLLFNTEATVYGNAPSQSLYSEYWSTYVSLLYNPKTRLIDASAIIPLADYFKMELNDIVEWRGNYYHLRSIADYNLANGECSLQLLGPILGDTISAVFGGSCLFDFTSSLLLTTTTTSTTTLAPPPTTTSTTTTTVAPTTTTTIAPTTSTTTIPTTTTTTSGPTTTTTSGPTTTTTSTTTLGPTTTTTTIYIPPTTGSFLPGPVVFLNPVGYDSSSAIWYDYSGNNNNYTVFGSNLTYGASGSGWTFNGTNNYLSGSTLPTLANDYTILSYFRYTNLNNQAIFQFGDSSVQLSQISWKLEPGWTPYPPSNAPQGAITLGGRRDHKIGSIPKTNGGTLSYPATSMFAYVNSASLADSSLCDAGYSGSTGYFNADKISYFTGSAGGYNINGTWYNGALCDTGSAWYPINLNFTGAASGSLIGKYSGTGAPLASYTLKSVIIYDRNLTDAEIKYTYNQFTASFGNI